MKTNVNNNNNNNDKEVIMTTPNRTQNELVMNKPLTKNITVKRLVRVYPLTQTTDYEISSDSIKKHIIKLMERYENIIPDGWEVTEKDFNGFIQKNNYGYGTKIEISETEIEWYETDYTEEFFEMGDDEEWDVNHKFWSYLLKEGSQDEKTTTLIKNYRERGKKGFEFIPIV